MHGRQVSSCKSGGRGGLFGVSPLTHDTRIKQKGDAWGSSANTTSSDQGEPTVSAGRKHPHCDASYQTLVVRVPTVQRAGGLGKEQRFPPSLNFSQEKGDAPLNKLLPQEARLTIPLDSGGYYKLSGAHSRTCTPGARCPRSTFYII